MEMIQHVILLSSGVFPPQDNLAQTICGNLLSQICHLAVPDYHHKCTHLLTSLALNVWNILEMCRAIWTKTANCVSVMCTSGCSTSLVLCAQQHNNNEEQYQQRRSNKLPSTKTGFWVHKTFLLCTFYSHISQQLQHLMWGYQHYIRRFQALAYSVLDGICFMNLYNGNNFIILISLLYRTQKLHVCTWMHPEV